MLWGEVGKGLGRPPTSSGVQGASAPRVRNLFYGVGDMEGGNHESYNRKGKSRKQWQKVLDPSCAVYAPGAGGLPVPGSRGERQLRGPSAAGPWQAESG